MAEVIESNTKVVESERNDRKRPMDLNIEMIDMRKHLRIAKIWAISKLMRSCKKLRGKTCGGNEAQIKKNDGRAGRLEQEIAIIKKTKPDDIFKALLQLDYNVSDFCSSSDLSLEERAIIHVGSVKLISERMMIIREHVNDFHFKRTQKRTPTAMQVAKRLRESKPLDDEQGMIMDSPMSDKEKMSSMEEKSAMSNDTPTATENSSKPESADEHLKIPQQNNRQMKSLTSDSVFETKKRASDIYTKDKSNARDSETSHIDCNKPEDDFLVSHEESKKAHGHDDCGDEFQAVEKAKEKECNDALSSYYERQQKVDARDDFNTLAKDAVDVTEVLRNIGDDFSSADEDQDIDQELNYEDLVEAGHKARLQALEDGSDKGQEATEEDLFFAENSGSTDKSFTRHIKSSETEAYEESAEKEIKSSFLGSLSEWHGRANKRKNRPSQRARRRAGRFPKVDGGGKVATNSKKAQAPAGTDRAERRDKNSVSGAAKPAEVSLHPSWEASKRRKQEQTTFKPFQGKRVCFDDSD